MRGLIADLETRISELQEEQLARERTINRLLRTAPGTADLQAQIEHLTTELAIAR